jgi:hypothetical protein
MVCGHIDGVDWQSIPLRTPYESSSMGMYEKPWNPPLATRPHAHAVAAGIGMSAIASSTTNTISSSPGQQQQCRRYSYDEEPTRLNDALRHEWLRLFVHWFSNPSTVYSFG